MPPPVPACRMAVAGDVENGLAAQPWRSLRLPEAPAVLAKACFGAAGYALLLCDLRGAWLERLDAAAVAQRSQVRMARPRSARPRGLSAACPRASVRGPRRSWRHRPARGAGGRTGPWTPALLTCPSQELNRRLTAGAPSLLARLHELLRALLEGRAGAGTAVSWHRDAEHLTLHVKSELSGLPFYWDFRCAPAPVPVVSDAERAVTTPAAPGCSGSSRKRRWCLCSALARPGHGTGAAPAPRGDEPVGKLEGAEVVTGVKGKSCRERPREPGTLCWGAWGLRGEEGEQLLSCRPESAGVP